MAYEINKGIGKAVEFQGLKAQYIFYMAAGLILVFLLFVILRFTGVEAMISIPLVVFLAGVLIYYIFYLNKKYGQHGIMKLMAKRKRPKALINFGYKKSGFFNAPKNNYKNAQ